MDPVRFLRRAEPIAAAIIIGAIAAWAFAKVVERGREGTGAGSSAAAASDPAGAGGAPATAGGAVPEPDAEVILTAAAPPLLPAASPSAQELPEETPQPPPAEAPPPPAPASTPSIPPGEKLRFREIWSYAMAGDRWSDAAPLTDLCLFDFSLDPTGKLSGKVNEAALRRAAARGIRTHLVVASSGNRSLLHLVLSPRYPVRNALLAELAALPGKHGAAGLQLDLEGPRPEERADLVSFVRELRAALPRTILLSLAIPAKTSDASGAYLYADLAGLADRLFVMVYDYHWKGGPAGPISDLAWHDAVLGCLRSRLPPGEVVIGLPFYGRVWQKEEVARALTFPQAEDLARRTAAPITRDPARSHTFTYTTEVTAECWYEDAASVRAKLASARARGFPNVGFWRLGQEDPRIWDLIEKEAP